MSRAQSRLPIQASRKPPSSDTQPSSVVALTSVALEYASLRHTGHCPLGMYIMPSTENLLIWDAVFFVHQGYYADAVLKLRLTFPETYPEKPPVVRFITDVFHPLISQNGVFNINPRFRSWRPKEHHVFDVLHWIKASFKKHALDQFKEEDCANKEAYRLYHDSIQSFAALANQSAMLSQSQSALYDKDHPSLTTDKTDGRISFTKLPSNQLSQLRKNLGLQEWE